MTVKVNNLSLNRTNVACKCTLPPEKIDSFPSDEANAMEGCVRAKLVSLLGDRR